MKFSSVALFSSNAWTGMAPPSVQLENKMANSAALVLTAEGIREKF